MGNITENVPLPQNIYITLVQEYKISNKPNVNVQMKMKEDSLKLKITRRIDTQIWKKSLTMNSLISNSPNWEYTFKDIQEIGRFIKYQFEYGGNKQIVFLGEENNINLIFEIDLKIDKRILNIKIPPEVLDVDKSFTLHSEILNDLQEKLNKLQIKSDIQIHRLFYLTKGKWKTSKTKFTKFPEAKGKFSLPYKSNIKLELSIGGIYTKSFDNAGLISSLLHIKFHKYEENSNLYIQNDNITYSNDIQFSVSGMTYYRFYNHYLDQFSGTHYFEDNIVLREGFYEAQLEIKVDGDYSVIWNSKHGYIYLDITIFSSVEYIYIYILFPLDLTIIRELYYIFLYEI